MYSTWDLIAACLVTAVGSHAVWILPRWLDRSRSRQAHTCVLNRHDGHRQPVTPRRSTTTHPATPHAPAPGERR